MFSEGETNVAVEIAPAGRQVVAPSAEQVLATCRDEDVQFVNLQFTDVMGIPKLVTIPIDLFEDVIEHGQWFDGSSIAGFARIAESDMFLMPDLATFTSFPWERGDNTTARVICWVHKPNGDLFPGDPRVVLLRQLERLARARLHLQHRPGAGVLPVPEGRAMTSRSCRTTAPATSTSRPTWPTTCARTWCTPLQEMGIKVEASHHEVAIGQHEIDFEYADALRPPTTRRPSSHAQGDRPAARAARHLHAQADRGHQRLRDAHPPVLSWLERGGNAFVDAGRRLRPLDDRQALHRRPARPRARHVGVLSPLVNSYRRLVPGYEAPVYVSWARTNRSALVRVPSVRAGRTAATRIELRCPDPSCNPYLAFAVMLAAGMDGIERELPLPEPVEENLYHFTEDDLIRRNVLTLPSTLGEAIEALRADDVIRDALGEHVYDRLTEFQVSEWRAFCQHVTAWERERYLEVY